MSRDGPVPKHAVLPRCRSFTLGDAMILVAATALSLAALRFVTGSLAGYFKGVTFTQLVGASAWRAQFSRTDVAITLLIVALAALAAFAYCWTPAYLLVRVRRRSLPWRVLWIQPGVVACLAQLVTFGVLAIRSLTPLALRLPAEFLADAAIPLTWMLLAATGRWRVEPGWIERLGRLLGGCWVVHNVSATAMTFWMLTW